MIINAPKRLFRKFIKKYFIPKVQFSYSQFGEDLIIAYFFNNLGINKPTYLDIGANEARYISNTFYFYEHGSKGVLIEPNPYLAKKLKQIRRNDMVENVGIGLSQVAEADFYLFPNYANGLSTFSKTEADHWQNNGMKGIGKIPIEKIIKMPLLPINSILEKYFDNTALNFISIDVEGLDLDILKTMDFEKYTPELICVETLMYNEKQEGYKNDGILQFMATKNYLPYADTRVNTIFARKELL
ncbi:MAG: FkbM family methyltransferase [Ferruginibacter sp.]